MLVIIVWMTKLLYVCQLLLRRVHICNPYFSLGQSKFQGISQFLLKTSLPASLKNFFREIISVGTEHYHWLWVVDLLPWPIDVHWKSLVNILYIWLFCFKKEHGIFFVQEVGNRFCWIADFDTPATYLSFPYQRWDMIEYWRLGWRGKVKEGLPVLFV